MNKLSGLSSQEAKQRLNKFGFNELERKKQPPWLKLLFDQFKSPLIYILFFAGLITLILKEWIDAVVIFLAVAVNTILGFIQEFKAEKSLVALRKILIPHATVIRDGKEEEIEVKDIVRGDLVVLKTGEKVPADGLVVEEADLSVNEAILTGESIPVKKLKSHPPSASWRSGSKLPAERDRPLDDKTTTQNLNLKEINQVFMGTVVVGGRGKMLVTQTGMKTKMGQIAGSLKETIDEATPLKEQVGKLSRTLAIVFSLICVIIFFEGILRQRPWLEMLILSTAVAVAAIPEGLVISLTVILTLGMQRVLQRKGLVRKLLAAETLGSVDVICADKTGTLTEGKMKVVKADFTDQNLGRRGVILCNNMINPLEISMAEWALRLRQSADPQDEQIDLKSLQDKSPRLDEIPFSSERKFIATLHQEKEGNKGSKGIIFLSGAPEMVMQITIFDKGKRKKWQEKLEDYTKRGFRVVAFAHKEGSLKELKDYFNKLKTGFKKYDGSVNKSFSFLKLRWLGLLLFEDPPRLEVKPALAACRQAGIEVKVITGDYKNTAVAVLKRVGLVENEIKDDKVMEGWQLEKAPEGQLKEKIEKVILFCRTTPAQKIRIVRALQENGHAVAMMGDGVNDALALKKADIGVVVGSASEVAKETADMVLLDSNFRTLVAAVEEGRGIFENIKKVVLYLLSDSFTEVILISSSLFLGLPTPLLPAQILWVNLVEDGLPGLALAFEPKDEGLMKEKPRPKESRIIDKELRIMIFVIGITTDFLLLAIFLYLLKIDLNLDLIRTVIFAGLAIDSLVYVFSCKTLRRNIWREKIFSNKFLVLSVLIGFILLFAGIYYPFLNTILKTVALPIGWWGLILAKGLITVIGIETVKWLFLQK